jgi:predicted phosphoadenosine phosphosulfate sulfurtransferase
MSKTSIDPYKILEPTCISFSGGRTSAYMLHKVLVSGGGNCQAMQLSVLQTLAKKMRLL